ncbi:hypothetical protein HDV00_004815 [Rhizophlyctis rosea]|nr:hypothetical protein HDV00_004815 [Rhizophlyctis rosea]
MSYTVYCLLCGGPPYRLNKRDLHPIPKRGLGNGGVDRRAVAEPNEWAKHLFRRPNSRFLKSICVLLERPVGDRVVSLPGVYSDFGNVCVDVAPTPENLEKYPEIANWRHVVILQAENETDDEEWHYEHSYNPEGPVAYNYDRPDVYQHEYIGDPDCWEEHGDSNGYLLHTLCADLLLTEYDHRGLGISEFLVWLREIGSRIPYEVYGAITKAQGQRFELTKGLEWTIARPDVFPEVRGLKCGKEDNEGQLGPPIESHADNHKSSRHEPQTLFPSLPTELVIQILSHLDLKSLLTLESSSRNVKAYLSSLPFNYMWLQLCIRRWWRGPYLKGNEAAHVPSNADWRQYVGDCVRSPHVRNWDRIQRVLGYFGWS